MTDVANVGMEEEGADITEKDTTMEVTIKVGIIDAAVEAITEDVHVDNTSALADNSTDGEGSSPRERRSKS
ncbi:MAG: hypothetical protein ACOC87_03190 [Candidatus Natronoplasma sp.]